MKAPRPVARLLRLALPHLSTFFSFSAMQAAQILLPLLALPWLARVLEPHAFGLLMYMSLIPPLVALVMDWGFPLGAAREAARLRGDREALARLMGAVFSGKLLLALACAAASLALLPLVPHAEEHPAAYGLAVLMGVSRGISPVWFFQGAGFGMRRMAAWDVGSSLGALALTFLCIRRPEAWPLYLLFAGLCKGLVYAALSLGLMRAWRARLSLRDGWHALGRTRTLFAGAVAPVLSTSGGQLVLGYFLSAADMGLLVAVNKIVRALVSLLKPAIQTLFPELCALHGHHSPRTARLLLLFLGGATGGLLLAAALAWLSAPWLIRVALGTDYAGAVPVLRLMLLLAPLLGCDMVLGAQVLVPLGLEREQTLVQWGAALLGLPLAALLGACCGVSGGALLPVAVEALTFFGLTACVLRFCPGALIPGGHLPPQRDIFPEAPLQR